MSQWPVESNFSTYPDFYKFNFYKINFNKINDDNSMYQCILPFEYYLSIHRITNQCIISISESRYNTSMKPISDNKK